MTEPKVLLVDDERDFLESLGQRLRLRGFEVTCAASGPEALAALEKSRAEVTVLDVGMPGMDGVAVLKEIKRRYQGVEVIMLTGHADLEASLAGMQLGFFDYLTKPVSIDRLSEKIRAAAEKARGQAQPVDARSFGHKMAERMTAADRLAALGTLAASIAHELRNPLAIIAESVGFARTLAGKRQDMEADFRDKLLLALDKAEASVDRARRISQRLLSFARSTEAVIKEIDLADLAGEVVELTKKPAAHAGIEVRICAEGGETKILVDPYLLRQVLLNLVTNAIQAGGEGGKVEIILGGGPEEAVIEVADDGPGIPAENLERIFEPFFTTKPVETGTGLGLSVSRSIVEELGGRLEVESAPGKGALFRMRLPRGSVKS
ncbi:MAG: response regulator [Desulfarculaceae bacterium]